MNNNRVKELTWLKQSANISKRTINQTCDELQHCTNAIPIVKQLIEKSHRLIASVRYSLKLSPCVEHSDRIDKISSTIEGIHKSIYTTEGKKMAHEIASYTAMLILEALDITVIAHDRHVEQMKTNNGIIID